jgi:DNA-binding MarR family transcriptional regulator
MIRAAVATVLDCYPKVFLACHRDHMRDEQTGQSLSSHQSAVLDHLDAVAPTHLHHLAAHLGVTPSSMSLMIDRLERGGYVRRSRDAGDARRVNLRLTRAGARIKEQQKVLDPSLVRAMLERLAPDDRQSALAGLRLLAGAAAELMASGQIKRLKQEMPA